MIVFEASTGRISRAGRAFRRHRHGCRRGWNQGEVSAKRPPAQCLGIQILRELALVWTRDLRSQIDILAKGWYRSKKVSPDT